MLFLILLEQITVVSQYRWMYQMHRNTKYWSLTAEQKPVYQNFPAGQKPSSKRLNRIVRPHIELRRFHAVNRSVRTGPGTACRYTFQVSVPACCSIATQPAGRWSSATAVKPKLSWETNLGCLLCDSASNCLFKARSKASNDVRPDDRKKKSQNLTILSSEIFARLTPNTPFY